MGSFLSTYGWGWAVAAAVAVLHLRSLPLAYTLRSLYHMVSAAAVALRRSGPVLTGSGSAG